MRNLERYNAAQRARCAVEKCIGVMKMRWRCLTKTIMLKPARGSRIMAACAALQNFAVDHRVDLDLDIDQEIVVQYQLNIQGGQQNAAGIRVRNELVNRVFTR